MVAITNWIDEMLNQSDYRTANYGGFYVPPDKHVFLQVPLGDYTEIPICMLSQFNDLLLNRSICPLFPAEGEEPTLPDMLLLDLYSKGHYSDFKTPELNFRVALSETPRSGLICIKGTYADTTTFYYATRGLLMNKDFKPLMMISWKFRKEHNDNPPEGTPKDTWRMLHPIMRMDPDFFICGRDSVWRFVCKKLLAAFLSSSRYPAYSHNYSYVYANYSRPQKPVVELAQCPFVLKEVTAPSFSTTDHQLCEVAAEHIADVNL